MGILDVHNLKTRKMSPGQLERHDIRSHDDTNKSEFVEPTGIK